MNNEKILNDPTFISVYVLSMILFPFILFFYIIFFYELDVSNFITIFMMFFVIISIFMLITNISQIMDKTNKINYSLIISCTMIIIPFIISLYVKFRDLPIIPKPDGLFLRKIMTYSVNIVMWAFTICIIYLNLISINSIDYHDAIPTSNNFLNYFIGILVTVIGLYYIVPKIFSLITLFRMGGFNISNYYD